MNVNGTDIAHSNGTDTKITKAHEHPSPKQCSRLDQPAPAHCNATASSGGATANKSLAGANNPMNLSTSPSHSSSSSTNNAAIAHANTSNIAMAAASLLSQAAASFLTSQSPAPVAHQNSSSNSAANPSFNTVKDAGKKSDLPREAHGRTQPLKATPPPKAAPPLKAAPKRSESAVASRSVISPGASSLSSTLFGDNSAVLEALAMAMAMSPSRLPQQTSKPLHSPENSNTKQPKPQVNYNQQRRIPNLSAQTHASKKISVKTAAKKAPSNNDMRVYDFEDKPKVSKTKSSVSSKSKRAAKRAENSSSHKRRKLLRDQDDEDMPNGLDDTGPGAERDEWVESVQPFSSKVYFHFGWKYPKRKSDNPFKSTGGSASSSRSASAMSNHRTASPSNGYIMKAPKAMMKKSSKRRSR